MRPPFTPTKLFVFIFILVMLLLVLQIGLYSIVFWKVKKSTRLSDRKKMIICITGVPVSLLIAFGIWIGLFAASIQ